MESFIICIVYVVVVIAIAKIAGGKNKTSEKYYAAERSLKWPLVASMVLAMSFAGPAISGPVSSGYESGIAVILGYVGQWLEGSWLQPYVDFWIYIGVPADMAACQFLRYLNIA